VKGVKSSIFFEVGCTRLLHVDPHSKEHLAQQSGTIHATAPRLTTEEAKLF